MPARPFDIGDRVIDREKRQATLSVVVARPEPPAREWVTYGGTTVTQANPGYPADASIMLVIDAADMDTYLPEWTARHHSHRPPSMRRGFTTRQSLLPGSPCLSPTKTPPAMTTERRTQRSDRGRPPLPWRR